jgi:hypothetical protein
MAWENVLKVFSRVQLRLLCGKVFGSRSRKELYHFSGAGTAATPATTALLPMLNLDISVNFRKQ